MFKFQIMICGIITNSRSDTALIPAPYMVIAFMFMQCPSTVGSQALFLGLQRKISMKIHARYQIIWTTRRAWRAQKAELRVPAGVNTRRHCWIIEVLRTSMTTQNSA